MKAMFWLAVLVAVAVIAFIARYVMRRISDRERASDARAAEFLAQMAGSKVIAQTKAAAPVPVGNSLETQKLLFDAASKAGDAGEPALALRLYERLLARFPESGFANAARVAAEAQQKRIKA